jgi:hypothetical protein
MANSIEDRRNASIRSFEENLKKAADGGFYIPDEHEARAEGILPETFEEKFPELNYDTPIVHESRISSRRPPIHLENAFREAFGNVPWARLIFDEYYRRWSIIQKCADGQWREGMVFMKAPVQGKLPADLDLANIDGRYDALWGKFGDYLEPSLEEMAWYRQTWDILENKGKMGKVQKTVQDERVRDSRREFEDYEVDFMEYYKDSMYQRYGTYDLDLALSNIKIATGITGLKFVPTTSKEAVVQEVQNEKYIYEERNGYKVKKKNPDYKPVVESPLKRKITQELVQGILDNLPKMRDNASEREAREPVSLEYLGDILELEKVYADKNSGGDSLHCAETGPQRSRGSGGSSGWIHDPRSPA